MRKFLLIFVLFFLIFNTSYANKWCGWPIYKPFDSIILFDRFSSANNLPKINDYSLPISIKDKLDNILYKLSEEWRKDFIKNYEKVFKELLSEYSENIKPDKIWDEYIYWNVNINKIKFLYSFVFYFKNEYINVENLKKSIVNAEEKILDNWFKLKITKNFNPNDNLLNCITIYDWYNLIHESIDITENMITDFKTSWRNIFFITFKNVGNYKNNKNLLKIYHIWVWRLTYQDPIYMNIVDISSNSEIINNFIENYKSN
jgi:hypothetical protein